MRFHDFGGDGYVITRQAATHLLERFPMPIYEIDWIIPRYWENGLSHVLYVQPPVVFHDEVLPSYIAPYRVDARAEYRTKRWLNPLAMTQRVAAQIGRSVRKRRGFRKLRVQDRGVGEW